MNSKQLFLFLAILSLTAPVYSQSATPFIVNAGGGAYQNASTQYEWNVGELAAIETYTSTAANIIISNGLLQPCTDKTSGYTTGFDATEIRVFPNVTPGKFELDISVRLAGQLDLELVNTTGQVIEKRNLRNECCGHTEHFDISSRANGIYLLVATLKPDTNRPVDGRQVIRRGTIKIIKISNN